MPASSAQVTKTSPRATMGQLLPGPRRETFQRRFDPGPQWSGAWLPGTTPLPAGPWKAGQSSAFAEVATKKRAATQTLPHGALPELYMTEMLRSSDAAAILNFS